MGTSVRRIMTLTRYAGRGNYEMTLIIYPQPDDITKQLVESEAGKKIDIMLGGGRASWLPREDAENRSNDF